MKHAKILSFILAGAVLLCGAACGTGTVHEYSLSDFTLKDGEYGEFYRIDLSSAAVVDEKGNATDRTVSIRSLRWPSGKETKVAGGSVKLTELGEYTVVYAAEDENGEETLYERNFTCRDTKGPIVGITEPLLAPKTAVKGQTVMLSAAGASDFAGIKGEIEVKVLSPSGKEETVKNSFVAEEAGEYTVVYTAEDTCGNTGEARETVTVWDVDAEQDVVGYTHLAYGVEQNEGMYHHEGYIAELFVPDVTKETNEKVGLVDIHADPIPAMPDGSTAATIITPSADEQRVTYVIKSAIADLTDYDYVGMWLYNASPRTERVSLNYHSSNEFTLKSGEWTYVAFDLNAYDYSTDAFCAYNDTGAGLLQPRNNVRHITLRFDYEWHEDEFDPDDLYGYRLKGYANLGWHTYIGKVVAGKLDESGFTTPAGAAYYTVFDETEFPVVSRVFHAYTTEVKEEGTQGSTLFENPARQQKLGLQIYMLKQFATGDACTIWVKNANGFDIVFDDGNGHRTTVPAGQAQNVPVTLYACTAPQWQGASLYGASIEAANGELAEGAKVYLGAIRRSSATN